MCEFCIKHGEGLKWYLSMENYSRDLLEQDGRREYLIHFLNSFEENTPRDMKRLERLASTPLLRLARKIFISRQKQNHYGQIVPIEEVEQILQQAEGVVRLPCVCRRVNGGQKNARYCYGLTLDKRIHDGLDDSFSLEVVSWQEASESINKLDKEGLVHSVWTFKTPYIGGLCNCDQDCMAYQITHSRGYYPVMFRAEWFAKVDWDKCNGCKNCMRQCQYGAVRYSAMNKKVMIDPSQCYGCGVCRAACHHDAILLCSRAEDPIAAKIW